MLSRPVVAGLRALRSQTAVTQRVAIRCMGTKYDPLVKQYAVEDDDEQPTDLELTTNRTHEELKFEEETGETYYDQDARAYLEEGTKDNPICILSETDERAVGISLPDESEVRWFWLREGEMAYDPMTNNYLALRVLNKEEIDAQTAYLRTDA